MKHWEKSVKNRQLHRQKQDAENIFFYLLKVRRGKKADRQSETRSLVLTEAINSRVVHWKAKRRNGRIRLYSQ